MAIPSSLPKPRFIKNFLDGFASVFDIFAPPPANPIKPKPIDVILRENWIYIGAHMKCTLKQILKEENSDQRK